MDNESVQKFLALTDRISSLRKAIKEADFEGILDTSTLTEEQKIAKFKMMTYGRKYLTNRMYEYLRLAKRIAENADW